MNQTIEDLKTRRSIRKFKDEQISDEDLKTILETGTYAPTGRGAQSPKIVVIQNPETIKELSAWNRSFFPVPVPEDMDPFYGAKTLLIVLANSEFPTYVEDGSSVLAVLVNAAHAVGVGSCWIHRARDEFASEKGKELLKECRNILAQTIALYFLFLIRFMVWKGSCCPKKNIYNLSFNTKSLNSHLLSKITLL